MSWSIFKQEMKAKMVNSSFKSTNEFADFFTQKYDQCMKRGLDVTTQNTVIKGNTELMRSTILYALEVGLNSKTPAFYNQSIALLGKGAVAYWSGVELGKIPPLIPAPGTILNLSVVTNTATNPGTWPPAPFPVFPSTSNDPYLDAFILQATIHLQTVSGVCNTISQYPPTAPPGPGILPWAGFNVEASPASRPVSRPTTTNAEEIIEKPGPKESTQIPKNQQNFIRKNLNKGWEGKQIPWERTIVNPAVDGPKLKKLYGENVAKAMLASMKNEQGFRGFNNNIGGYDITAGGWRFDPNYHNGFVVPPGGEGTTGLMKTFISFKTLDSFYEKTAQKFTERGADKIANAEQFAEFYYQKWFGGNSAAENAFNTYPKISVANGGKYATLADYQYFLKNTFKKIYREISVYVR
jgi:hypothetical protein